MNSGRRGFIQTAMAAVGAVGACTAAKAIEGSRPALETAGLLPAPETTSVTVPAANVEVIESLGRVMPTPMGTAFDFITPEDARKIAGFDDAAAKVAREPDDAEEDPTIDTLYYRVEPCMNERCVCLHLRHRLPYMSDTYRYGLGNDPDCSKFGKRLYEQLMNVPGVTAVSCLGNDRYTLNLSRGDMFCWREILPEVKQVLMAAFQANGAIAADTRSEHLCRHAGAPLDTQPDQVLSPGRSPKLRHFLPVKIEDGQREKMMVLSVSQYQYDRLVNAGERDIMEGFVMRPANSFRPSRPMGISLVKYTPDYREKFEDVLQRSLGLT